MLRIEFSEEDNVGYMGMKNFEELPQYKLADHQFCQGFFLILTEHEESKHYFKQVFAKLVYVAPTKLGKFNIKRFLTGTLNLSF